MKKIKKNDLISLYPKIHWNYYIFTRVEEEKEHNQL